MAPKYKLTYFNNTSGLGEPIRYLLSYGNLDYEDVKVDSANWPNVKGTTPFGKLPLLEVDGKVATQSSAICRYLAKQLKLTGKTDWDALEADIIIDTLTDLRLTYVNYFREQDPEKKAKEMEQIKNVHNPFYLSKFEEQVKKNGGHFVNGQLTWADIYFAAFAELVASVVQASIVDQYPNLKALKQKVESIPAIKAYIDKKPKSTHLH